MELEDEAQVAVTEVAERLLRKRGGVNRVDTYGTAVRTVEGADNLQECRLASATGADDADDLAAVYVEVNAFQYL